MLAGHYLHSGTITTARRNDRAGREKLLPGPLKAKPCMSR